MTAHDWWRNCAGVPDAETDALDRLEDDLAPLSDDSRRIRALIGGLEMCHHKAERWVERILESIRSGEPSGGLGSRPAGERHSVEEVWQAACDVLRAWIDDEPERVAEVFVGDIAASVLLEAAGPADDLKRWQVRRVEERIREFIGWPRGLHEPEYVMLLEAGSDYTSVIRTGCPPEYRNEEEYWRATVDTILRDEPPAEDPLALQSLASGDISLALAIDMLMPCNWNFADNLHTILAAIGGETKLRAPFAACARNIRLSPLRPRMIELISHPETFETQVQEWLGASLRKTIRSQLEIPDA